MMPGNAAEQMESNTYATRVPVTDQPKCRAMPAQTPAIMESWLERFIPPLSLILHCHASAALP
jgi:hypothetical protein